jgi:hypothetical protein
MVTAFFSLSVMHGHSVKPWLPVIRYPGHMAIFKIDAGFDIGRMGIAGHNCLQSVCVCVFPAGDRIRHHQWPEIWPR